MTRRERRAHRGLKRTLGATLLPRVRPDRALRARHALRRWGPTPAGAIQAAAAARPQAPAIIDEHTSLSFAELHQRVLALSGALAQRGIGPGQTLALICANHHWTVEAQIAASRLGASTLQLHPEMDPCHAARLLGRHRPAVVIHDPDSPPPPAAGASRLLTGPRAPAHAGERIEEAIAAAPALTSVPRAGAERVVTLTSPGCWQPVRLPGTLTARAAQRCAIPLRARQTTMICPPLSSPWGHLHLTLALRLGSTLILHERFSALEVLDALERRRVSALALLPEMLAAIMELPASTLAWYKAEALRVIAVNGAQLPAELAIPAIRRFGPILYNRSGPPVIRLGSGGEGRYAPAG